MILTHHNRIFLIRSAVWGVMLGALLPGFSGQPFPSAAVPAPFASAAGQTSIYLPIIMGGGNGFPPIHQTSYYMKTVNTMQTWSIGCDAGLIDKALPGTQDTAIILNYGAPKTLTDGYGASMYGLGPVSVSQIATAVESVALGYSNCVDIDRISRLTIIVGTNNSGSEVTAAHGQAWARMVNDIQQWVTEHNLSSQVVIAGGSNMELGWNTPTVTRAWVDAYDAVNLWRLYDFGDAAGCPPYGDCGTATYPEWTQEDVWYISWGNPAVWPLPLIFTTNGSLAEEWYQLSVYAYTAHGQRMNFAGVVTQSQACAQRGSCSGTDNTPQQGYLQLYSRLNADPRTAQPMPWSLDFRWWGE